jgi:Family of unknown function (DUF6084)
MPDLNFELVGAEVPTFAAVPTLLFKLKITNTNAQEQIHSIILRSQIQINATQRRYTAEAQRDLHDIFDSPDRWNQTLKSLLWTHTSTAVPAFSGSIIVDLPVSCTYDFEVVSTKYFAALEAGEIPLTFLFSGSIFYQGAQDNLQVTQIPWSKEAHYRLPVERWKAMIEHYYPNTAWIRLQKDVFDQLYQYKVRNGLPTWEEALVRLLQTSGEGVEL